MKNAILIVLAVIAVCSLCFGGIVNAYKTGYFVTQYQGSEITANGQVSPATEWDDAYKDWLYDGWTKTNSRWAIKWEMGGTPYIADQWLIEVLSDTTNDAGDTFTFCFDGQTDGGTAPKTDDVKVVITGHTGGTVNVYRGTGTTWAADPAIVIGTNIIVGHSISSSPTSATPHWIIEMKFDKSGGIAGTGIPSCVRLEVYDASTGKTLMWPPESAANVPDTYGYLDADISGTSIPEGLTVGIMMMVSCVALVVSLRYFRRPRNISL
ncbi:MAG: hypothetical protein QXU99_01675 [Candidatus Bathyarchaeia archaeon]